MSSRCLLKVITMPTDFLGGVSIQMFHHSMYLTQCNGTSLVAPFYIYAGVDSKHKLERDNMIHPSL